jgi:Domain of unknown function (DUF4158)
MKRPWSPDELAAHGTLTDAERQLLPDRVDHNRLGFAAHLQCFEHEARFPESPKDIPAAALNALSTPLQILSAAFARYDWHLPIAYPPPHPDAETDAPDGKNDNEDHR